MIYTFIVAFKDQTRHVLNSMMGYISLPAILQKIMQVNFHWLKNKFPVEWRVESRIGLVLVHFALWLVQETPAILSASQLRLLFFSHIKLLTCVSFDLLWNLHYFWSKLMITFLSTIFIVLKITLAFCTLIHSLSALYLFTFCTLFIYLLHSIHLPSTEFIWTYLFFTIGSDLQYW